MRSQIQCRSDLPFPLLETTLFASDSQASGKKYRLTFPIDMSFLIEITVKWSNLMIVSSKLLLSSTLFPIIETKIVPTRERRGWDGQSVPITSIFYYPNWMYPQASGKKYRLTFVFLKSNHMKLLILSNFANQLALFPPLTLRFCLITCHNF
jgi:hypothetical protein